MIDPTDLQIDTYTSGPQNPVRVVVTHRPSGIVREATRKSALEARAAAVRYVTDRLEHEALMDALRRTENLQKGDPCEFRYPARRYWLPGIVQRNGGSGHWVIRDEAAGKLAHGLYIEHVRAPGTNLWS